VSVTIDSVARGHGGLSITCHTSLTSPRADTCGPDDALSKRSFPGVVQEVARALSLGVALSSRSHSVGRYHEATYSGPPRWACIDRTGAVVPWLEVEEHCTSLYSRERVERQDWSTFGAAMAFVCAVGRETALRAVARLHISSLVAR
jgi:hypothetical protein